METLAEKIVRLKSDAIGAIRVADFWQSQIAKHGERKTQEFYLSLGHNHIEKKGFDWEGLTLSREPKEHEKIAVKGVSQAQQSAKESITSILLSLRQELILDGLEGIKKLDPATYHTLILQVPPEFRRNLRDRLISTYRQGRRLVAVELGKAKSQTPAHGTKEYCALYGNPPIVLKQDDDEDEFDDLDMLTDLTDARVINDVQSRLIADAGRYALLGLTGAALINAVRGQMVDGSVSYIDRTSTGIANKVISIGRSDEAERRKDDWQRIEYSSLLDANVCDPCLSEDGKESADGSDLQPTPNPDCLGADFCRCFWVYVQD